MRVIDVLNVTYKDNALNRLQENVASILINFEKRIELLEIQSRPEEYRKYKNKNEAIILAMEDLQMDISNRILRLRNEIDLKGGV